MKLYKFLPATRFVKIRKVFKDRPFNLLDVGCGHLSFEMARHYFPGVTYHGVDKRYQGNLDQYAKMDRFFDIDLENQNLDAIPNAFYDVIVFSHTIEHLRNGDDVLTALIPKLKPGGYFYVEFPSVRTLSFPSADGTLNFCDDPTHVRLYDIKEIANLFLRHGVKIIRAGRAKGTLRKLILPPLGLLYNLYYWIRHRRFSARGLIELTGFSEFVWGQKLSP